MFFQKAHENFIFLIFFRNIFVNFLIHRKDTDGGGGVGTTTIRTNDIPYNSQKPDISYTDNWYKNETGHFVQNYSE